ncbi:MAG: ring-cleaving dioxygenase [Tepidisphaeraceae bacterium]
MQLTGFHHLTAISADARGNVDFYTRSLGMRMVKKTVNQDDTSAYHFFYADGDGSPGTDITFFDWPARPERRGTQSITRTGLRVASVDSLKYWENRLSTLGVTHGEIVDRDERPTLDFDDPEGQRLAFVLDDGRWTPHSWGKSPVPAEHQVLGLGPITISVRALEPTADVLTKLMEMRETRSYESSATDGSDRMSTVHVFEMGQGGPSAELHVAVEPEVSRHSPGAGRAHHVAFRVPTFDEYDQWFERLQEFGVRSSGPVDRFYFRSLYFREPGGILFELATDQPGFSADEPKESMGEKLSLPPFLEGQRAEIEAGLKPIE